MVRLQWLFAVPVLVAEVLVMLAAERRWHLSDRVVAAMDRWVERQNDRREQE
jgi:hypothetical protein